MKQGETAALIQPFGFHIGLSAQLRVIAASDNVGAFLHGASASALIGQPMTALACPDAVHAIRNRMALLRSEAASDQLFACSLREDGPPLDLSVRRVGEGFIIDAEPATRTGSDALGIVAGELNRISACTDRVGLAKRAADEFRALTGSDKIVVFLTGLDPVSSRRSANDAGCPDRGPPAEATIVDSLATPVSIESRSTVSLASSELAQASDQTLSWLASAGAQSGLLLHLAGGQGSIACLHASARHIALERRCMARILASLVGMQARIIRSEC